MKANDDTTNAAPQRSTLVLVWDSLQGEPTSDRNQALPRSFAGLKVIVMGNPPGDQLRSLMQSLLGGGARMAAGVDADGETHIAVQGMAA